MGLRDPVSSAAHLLAAGWAVYATLVLMRLAPPGDGRRHAAGVFGLSMTALYLASGVYHAVPRSDALWAFHAADRSAIFLMIAGTNTPVIVTLLPRAWRRWALGAMWGLALVGIAAVWLLPQAPYWVTVGLYVGMGWLGGVLPIVHYVRAVGWRGMSWAVAGGVLYTGGALCDLLKWPQLTDAPVRVGPHEVFHLAVVAGSAAFFVFVARHVLLWEPPAVGAVVPEVSDQSASRLRNTTRSSPSR
jgi:hemolysin III